MRARVAGVSRTRESSARVRVNLVRCVCTYVRYSVFVSSRGREYVYVCVGVTCTRVFATVLHESRFSTDTRASLQPCVPVSSHRSRRHACVFSVRRCAREFNRVSVLVLVG